MSKLPSDLSADRFGEVFVSRLREQWFGVVRKAESEVLQLYAMLKSSESRRGSDSYGRAEMLRITDQKYRTLIKRAAIWLDDESSRADDNAFFTEFLTEVLEAYSNAPEQTEVRLLVDDEVRRRNIVRALERASANSKGIPVEISLTGRALVLRATDLEAMLERVKHSSSLPQNLRKLLKEKKGRELRIKVLECVKDTGVAFTSELARVMVGKLFEG